MNFWREKEIKRDIFGILYTGLPNIHIKDMREREKEGEIDRERDRQSPSVN